MARAARFRLNAPEQKKVGIWTCAALVIGNMIGSGIFLLPASLAAFGAISILGWLFTATGAMLIALVFARLSRMVPQAGGPYAYTRRGFGELAGFLIAWGYWISILCGNAAIAVAMISYLGVFVPALGSNGALAGGTAVAVIWLLSLVNARGVRTAGYVQIVTTVLKLLPLVLLGTLGFAWFNADNFLPFNVSGRSDFSAITATAALTLWAFLGLESATVPAGDVEDPERTIPRATVLGTLIAAVIYISTTAAVMGIIAPSTLAESQAPFAEAASRIWGSWAGYAVAAGAVISCFGALNGWILNAGQIPLAAARDDLFPRQFARVTLRGAPTFSIAVSAVLVTLLVATNYTRGLVGLFTFAILLSTLTALVPYAFSAMAELMIFVRERERFRGASLARDSIIAVLAFAYSLWAISGAGHEPVFWGFLLLLAGLPVYVWIVWRRARGAPPADPVMPHV
ncbi:MAG TPA: amino acid permease [Gammaproteobacteria bacterium]|nr:amino acid permease [Gammaproteobacteria bacterium]